MYSIRQIAEAAEKLVPGDHLSGDDPATVEQDKADYIAKLDKSLRNLSQRVYLPAAERKGRVDLYDRPTVAAFALIVALSDFDVPLHQLQAFAKWAQQPGNNRSPSPIQEAVQRIARKENFTFEILGAAFGRKSYRARWRENNEVYKEMDEGRSGRGMFYPSLTLPASDIIRSLLNGLDN
jgi:hypothetical protein